MCPAATGELCSAKELARVNPGGPLPLPWLSHERTATIAVHLCRPNTLHWITRLILTVHKRARPAR